MTEKIQRNLVIVACFSVTGIFVFVILAIGKVVIEKPIVEPQSSVLEEESSQENPDWEEAIITGRLVNTITDKPMPGIPVVAARTSAYTTTKIDGTFILDVSASDVYTRERGFDLYGVGGVFFEQPGTFNVAIGDDVTLYLTPKDPPAGMTVTFPDVEYAPTDGGSTILRGRAVDAQSGKPMADLPVVFFGESLFARTDDNGFFSLNTLGGRVHRMYFIDDEAVDDSRILYQVISVPGYEGTVSFSL